MEGRHYPCMVKGVLNPQGEWCGNCGEQWPCDKKQAETGEGEALSSDGQRLTDALATALRPAIEHHLGDGTHSKGILLDMLSACYRDIAERSVTALDPDTLGLMLDALEPPTGEGQDAGLPTGEGEEAPMTDPQDPAVEAVSREMYVGRFPNPDVRQQARGHFDEMSDEHREGVVGPGRLGETRAFLTAVEAAGYALVTNEQAASARRAVVDTAVAARKQLTRYERAARDGQDIEIAWAEYVRVREIENVAVDALLAPLPAPPGGSR